MERDGKGGRVESSKQMREKERRERRAHAGKKPKTVWNL